MKKRSWIFWMTITILFGCIVMSQNTYAQTAPKAAWEAAKAETEDNAVRTISQENAKSGGKESNNGEISYLYLIFLIIILVAGGALIIIKDGNKK